MTFVSFPGVLDLHGRLLSARPPLSGAFRHRTPALLDPDPVSALRRLTLGGNLTRARPEGALTDFEDLPLRRWTSTDTLRRRAFDFRADLSA